MNSSSEIVNKLINSPRLDRETSEQLLSVMNFQVRYHLFSQLNVIINLVVLIITLDLEGDGRSRLPGIIYFLGGLIGLITFMYLIKSIVSVTKIKNINSNRMLIPALLYVVTTITIRFYAILYYYGFPSYSRYLLEYAFSININLPPGGILYAPLIYGISLITMSFKIEYRSFRGLGILFTVGSLIFPILIISSAIAAIRFKKFGNKLKKNFIA